MFPGIASAKLVRGQIGEALGHGAPIACAGTHGSASGPGAPQGSEWDVNDVPCGTSSGGESSVRLLRGLLGGLLWLLACLVGLVGAVACVTLILLPIGIPLLGLARRLFGKSLRLFMPAALAHPIEEPKKRGRKARKKSGKKSSELAKKARRTMADKTPSPKVDAGTAAKKGRKLLKRQRKRMS